MAFAFGAHAPKRIEQPFGRIFAFQIAGDFAAQKSARYRMLGIAAKPGALAIFDVDEEGASVRAIERAYGMADLGGQAKIIATGGALGRAPCWWKCRIPRWRCGMSERLGDLSNGRPPLLTLGKLALHSR